MSSPIMMPPVIYTATPVPPAGYGLYAAATIFDTGENRRHLGGVSLWPYNCDPGHGVYSAAICAEDAPAVKAAGERLDPTTFDPLVVWAASECAPDQTEAEVQARATHTLSLHEQLLVESAFATRLLADAGTPTDVPDLVTGIGVLEEFLGEQGYVGNIHAARRWAAPASQYRWTNHTGALLRSPLGHTYVFGGGYGDTLGNTLVATGPLYLWRDTVSEYVQTTGSHAEAAFNNSVYALAERIVVPAYECAIAAVTIVPEP